MRCNRCTKLQKNQGLASDVAQLQGDHDHVIYDLANRWGADLIVLGQHDLKQNDLAPPVWFAEQAPCSVLLAQKPDSLHLKASQVEQFAMMA
ncbi:MAG: universal stress protein [Leptolyngbyaceae cyanobacterium CSU_1_4]|nr:universal stress protein [Leptolyngbyaceae cyanobacterium CSU_1_4]